MNKRFNNLRVVVGILVLTAVFLLLAAQPAAATGQQWAKWKIQVNFQGNVINPKLVVEIGHTTPSGNRVIDDVEHFTITCTVVGNPTVQNNQATFNGNSYYQCEVPSIQQKVSEMTSGMFIIASECEAKRPYITSIVSLDDTPVQLAANNPLFYRDDITFSLPLDITTGQAQISTVFDNATAESSNFFPGITNHTIMAIYNKGSGMQYTPAFTVDTFSYSSTPATINQMIGLSTLESTIYFGYSPTTNEYFEGVLTSLIVDPYCIGTG